MAFFSIQEEQNPSLRLHCPCEEVGLLANLRRRNFHRSVCRALLPYLSWRPHIEFHLTGLQIKNCVCVIALREDGLLRRKEHFFLTLTEGGEERLDIELAAVLGNFD